MSFFQNTAGSSGTGGIFGSTNNNSNTAGGSSIFGNAANKPAGTGIFGAATSNTGTIPPSGGLFGNTGGTSTPAANATTSGSTPAAPTNNLFGSFNLPKPTEQSTAAQKPAASNFFSQPSSTTAVSTSSMPASGGGLFGSLKPPENAAAAGTSTSTTGTTPAPSSNIFGSSTPSTTGTTPASSGSLFGGGGIFGNKPAGTSTPAPASSSPAPGGTFSLGGNGAPASGGFFGAKPAEKKDDKPAENATGSATSPAPTTSLFGSTSTTKPEEKKDASAPAASAGMFGLNKPKEGDKPATTPSATLGVSALGGAAGAGSITPNVTVTPPSMLKGKTIEEIVNKWSSELETHVREFNKFAAEVSMWDRALIENGNNLAALYSHVLAAERDRNEVDQSLAHIEQQQKELSATLDAYEKATQELFTTQGGALRMDSGPADTERDKNYMLATDLHTHLDDMSGSLTQMIESVNSLSVPTGEGSQDEPMTQISQILSSHLESLQWIDGAVREIEGKVNEVEKRVKESGHGSSLNGNGVKRGFGLR
ncbi:hypothetical protein D9758_001184 [Tetrapyrgos nigripes]|uniref:Nucleoporin NSP1 n=1 Tax=Tetrapyrgos nigripes TaxID=182062 RepID=A0A8H5LUK4_9AGAR|nr:hypothetical protein D9758_001184 [Tetrapyrgos nigripes]